MFTDHKIEAFTRTISSLPDEPQISAQEMKACFDSSPEQLRKSLNAVCDDANKLEGRVDSIIQGSFDSAIKEEMIDPAYRATLATQSDVTDLTQLVSDTKCEIVTGYYIGNGAMPREFNLGFKPRAVVITDVFGLRNGYDDSAVFSAIGVPEAAKGYTFVELTDTGFKLNNAVGNMKPLNFNTNHRYAYIAFRTAR